MSVFNLSIGTVLNNKRMPNNAPNIKAEVQLNVFIFLQNKYIATKNSIAKPNNSLVGDRKKNIDNPINKRINKTSSFLVKKDLVLYFAIAIIFL
jgi:hypothetical protein